MAACIAPYMRKACGELQVNDLLMNTCIPIGVIVIILQVFVVYYSAAPDLYPLPNHFTPTLQYDNTYQLILGHLCSYSKFTLTM